MVSGFFPGFSVLERGTGMSRLWVSQEGRALTRTWELLGRVCRRVAAFTDMQQSMCEMGKIAPIWCISATGWCRMYLVST